MNTADLQKLQRSPHLFRQSLRIDCDGTEKPLGQCLDPWQQEDFQALDPAWKAICGQRIQNPIRRFYLERCRGASKTSDIAIMASWALFASRRQIKVFCGAVDKDQASLIRQAIETLLRLNPWLSKILSTRQNKILNERTGSFLECLSSDGPSSYGLLADAVLLDELSVHQKPDLWESLFSTIAKKKNSLLCIISNAGYHKGQSWQWKVREQARTSEDWYFHQLKTYPSWISPKQIAEQKKILPAIAFRRLFENTWTDGEGDALNAHDINNSVVLDGPSYYSQRGYSYFAGLDLGVSRDRAALCILSKNVGYLEELEPERKPLSRIAETMIDLGLRDEPVSRDPESVWHDGDGKYRLAQMVSWSPTEKGKIQIEDVEKTVLDMSLKFPGMKVGCDPWNAAYLIQRLSGKGVDIKQTDFSPSNLKTMCSQVLEVFSEGLIDLFDDSLLVTDLLALQVQEKTYGLRLISPRGPSGHGDSATSLAIALLLAGGANTPINSLSPDYQLICE